MLFTVPHRGVMPPRGGITQYAVNEAWWPLQALPRPTVLRTGAQARVNGCSSTR